MAGMQVRLLAGASAAALLASGVVAAGASGLSVSVTVPAVGSVEARLPVQQVPSVSVPSVTVPSVTVPSVPTPPAPEPAPLPSPPSVQTPTLQTPTVQAPSAQAPSAPAAPSVGAVQQQSVPATGATAPEPSTAGAGGGTAAASAGSSGASSSAGQGSADPGDAPSVIRGDRILAGGGGSFDRPMGGAITQRRLELAVERARQCLDDLGPGERRVLDLRAGVGPGTPLSRPRVARRLGLGLAQTRRIERRGLRRLDTLASAGACGGATSGSLMAAGALAMANGDAPLVAAVSDLPPRSGVGGVVAHGGGDPGASGRSGFDALPPPIGDGGEATLLVSLGLLVALALLVRRELSRR